LRQILRNPLATKAVHLRLKDYEGSVFVTEQREIEDWEKGSMQVNKRF
jgi:hypothetical protein